MAKGMDPQRIRNPFTDLNQTQHNSLRSGDSSTAKPLHQPIKGVRPTRGQHISFLLVILLLFLFILLVSWLSALQKQLGRFGQPVTTDTSYDAVSRSKCLLGVATLAKTPKVVIFPKTAQNWAPNGFPALNKTMNNF